MEKEIRYFRKLMVASIFCSFALILLNSAPILAGWPTVTSPSAGETWAKGCTYTIQWRSMRTDNPLVIDLCTMEDDGDEYGEYVDCFKTIAQNVPNGEDETGSYSWTVPSNLKNRTNYVISVGDMYSLYGGGSDEFTISNSDDCGGDGPEDCSPFCVENFPGNGSCNLVCNNSSCNFDDGDCIEENEDPVVKLSSFILWVLLNWLDYLEGLE